MRRSTIIVLAITAAAAAGAFLGLGLAGGGAQGQGSVADGRSVFNRSCAGCHPSLGTRPGIGPRLAVNLEHDLVGKGHGVGAMP